MTVILKFDCGDQVSGILFFDWPQARRRRKTASSGDVILSPLHLQSALNCEGKPERKHAKEDLEHDPPPVPRRQLKPNGKRTTQSDLVTCEMSSNNSNVGDVTLPRRRCFQIVQQICTVAKNEDNRKDYEHHKLPNMVENKEEPATDKLRSEQHKLANVAEKKRGASQR